MNKKNLFYWALYDFANSFVFINFLLYFSQWLVVDDGLSDFWYNAVFAIASILLLFSAPTLAAFTDKHGGRKYFLKISTIGMILSYSFSTILAYMGGSIFLITVLFLLGQYFYQLSFCFYNPMIDDIADSQHRARAFGIGQFSNNFGQVIGLLVALPFSASRLSPLGPSLIITLILSLPMLVLFKEQKSQEIKLTIKEFNTETRFFFKKLILFFSMSVAIPILVAFFFFNDALVTISNNYSIYLERVFAIPDTTKNIILMLILLMSAFGGLIFGKITDKIGTTKSLKIILGSWMILLPLLGLAKSLPFLIIMSVLLGFFMGGIWTVTRTYLGEKLNKYEMGYGFSFYALFERFATFVGPLTWGIIVTSNHSSPLSYRIAVITMTIYIVAGYCIIHFWKRKKVNI